MQQLITWRDLKLMVNRLTDDQLNNSLCINVADAVDTVGEFYGVSDDGSLPKILFVEKDEDAPIDEDEPYLRLEI